MIRIPVNPNIKAIASTLEMLSPINKYAKNGTYNGPVKNRMLAFEIDTPIIHDPKYQHKETEPKMALKIQSHLQSLGIPITSAGSSSSILPFGGSIK
mmetsp:Transcript_16966/g.18947  ORF Transcript_16966/g.18947 Transcript_16966/m.18947 type:complete len:97 (-) Transcript_16966:193-483(-)